jgi:hypothetical protein
MRRFEVGTLDAPQLIILLRWHAIERHLWNDSGFRDRAAALVALGNGHGGRLRVAMA